MPNMYFKYTDLKFLTLHFCLLNGLSACRPAVRPGSTMARAPVFSQNKGNRIGFMQFLFQKTFIHSTMVLPFMLYKLVSFCLQITYRKVRNLQIGVNKLVGKVSINLLHHTKFIMSCKVSLLCNQHNY